MKLASSIFVQQLMGFLAAGAIGTVVQYVVLWWGVEARGLPAPLASGLGYALGAVVNYCLSYFFIFKSDAAHLQSVSRFVMMVAIGWMLTMGMMWVLDKKFDWYYWPAQILTTLVVLAWNFLVSRWWVFKK